VNYGIPQQQQQVRVVSGSQVQGGRQVISQPQFQQQKQQFT
jgi:hypothetical protein